MLVELKDLRLALERDEVVPSFQPMVELTTGRLAGFEVLARWQHPEAGPVLPENYISLAETSGLIGQLMRQVLRKALVWASDLPKTLVLAVNVSPIQLRGLTLPLQIREEAERLGFSLDRLVVEITESAILDNLQQAREIASELKAMGCKLALDDFGTGYSSLSHLQSLPFDQLKIDRSFVGSMDRDRESRKIVAAVVGLGQSLGLATIAEGVETEQQAEMLLWLGCEMGQGWLYGRPVPGEALVAEVSASRKAISRRAAFPSKDLSIGNLEGPPAQRLAHLQAVYDGAPVGLGFLDCNLKYVNLNRQLADMHGMPVKEHLGRTAQEITPHVFPAFEPYLQRALNGEATEGFEVCQPASGSMGEKTLLASYQPALDEAGEVVGVSVAVVDFTARKKAQERLQRYERVVEGLDEMVVVVDRDYHCVLANRAYLDYRGITTEQLTGCMLSDRVGVEVFETVVKEKLDECFNGSIVKFEMKLTYPHYGERDIFVSYFPVEVGGGVTGAACVLRDITELKRLGQTNQDWQQRMELAQEGASASSCAVVP